MDICKIFCFGIADCFFLLSFHVTFWEKEKKKRYSVLVFCTSFLHLILGGIAFKSYKASILMIAT